jgi:hypothetical protein
MHRLVLLLTSVVLLSSMVVGAVPAATAQSNTTTQCQAPIECHVFNTVTEWQTGLPEGLIVSNNEGGEVRLADRQSQGTYTTGYIASQNPIAAVAAVWSADVPAGTSLALEFRAGATQDDARTAPWRALAAADARSQTDAPAFALKSPVPVISGTLFVQLRVSFATQAQNASPVLDRLTLHFVRPITGPRLSPETPPRVIIPFGPLTITNPPRMIQRSDWDRSPPPLTVPRQPPRGIIVHQIGNETVGDDPLPFLRTIVPYHTQVLGWDDIPFHFLVDQAGTVFEGHVGGPTAVVPRLAGGDTVVHVALIGSGTPSDTARTALADLLAWLGQAYNIAPLGQHTVANPSADTPAQRPNIAVHSEIIPEAAGQTPELREQAGALRTLVDQRTVRSRWYFPEGNPQQFRDRISVLNLSGGQANVTFNVLKLPEPTLIRTATLDAGARADLMVSELVSDTTEAPAIIESNTALLAERFMDFGNDLIAAPGINQLSRVWYFAEGSTENAFNTYLLLFNPNNQEARATITYMLGDGTTAELRDVQVPPRRRLVITVADAPQMQGAGFGTRVIATRPIAVQRTMTFGGEPDQPTGAHSSPGVVELSRRWYFAEGTTAPPFQMQLSVLNPNAQPVTTTVTFFNQDGNSLTRRYAIPPTTRLKINVNEVVPELGVATRVDADRPIAVERTMYWRNGNAGAVSPGAIRPAYLWRFADGRTSDGFQQFLLFNNPDKNYQARVTVEFVLADGRRQSQSIVLAGGARYTMAVHEIYPNQATLATTVRSTYPIIVERSLFAGAPNAESNRGGATVLGFAEVEP